jgi:uncharacterized protein
MRKLTSYFYPFLRWFMITSLLVIFILLLLLLFRDAKEEFGYLSLELLIENLAQKEFLIFLAVGFIAQIIDGALGMAYGVTSSTFLISLGVPPATASASVHLAEVFTTGVSGLSHLRLGNVKRSIFIKLVIPGMIGAVIGAYLLTSIDPAVIKPVIALYLLVIGAVIIKKAFGIVRPESEIKNISPLGLVGGFVDAVGGGGWGAVVTSTLLGKGHHPRYTIGSVNMAEFFIALSSAGIFTIILGISNWNVILGLIGGGVIAAPLAAFVCRYVKPRVLMVIVGAFIILLSIRTLVLTFA